MIFLWMLILNLLNNQIYPTIADSLYTQKDYYNAATEYERFIFHYSASDDSMLDNIRLRLATCYFYTNEFIRAEKITKQISAQHSDLFEDATLLQAQYYIRDNQMFKAKLELSDLIFFSKNQEKQHKAYILLGYIALQEREVKEAAKYFNLTQDTVLVQAVKEMLQVPKKNTALSQIMSSVIPGSGEIYCGKYGWGLLSLLVNTATIYGTINCYKNKQYLDASLIFTLFFTRFYNGSRNNARDFAVAYNEKIYRAKLKEIHNYCFQSE